MGSQSKAPPETPRERHRRIKGGPSIVREAGASRTSYQRIPLRRPTKKHLKNFPSNFFSKKILIKFLLQKILALSKATHETIFWEFWDLNRFEIFIWPKKISNRLKSQNPQKIWTAIFAYFSALENMTQYIHVYNTYLCTIHTCVQNIHTHIHYTRASLINYQSKKSYV